MGRFVAYSRDSQHGLRLTSRELRRGRVVRDARVIDKRKHGSTGVIDLKLKRNGSLAWIVKRIAFDGPLNPYAMPDPGPEYQVRTSDRTGNALLDSGYDIAPDSLRLRRGTVSWKKGTSTHSATLD